MWSKLVFLIIQLNSIYWINAVVYELIPDKREFVQVCENQPANVLSLAEAFDMSAIVIYSRENTSSVYISGNYTTQWKGVEPSDLVTVSGQLLQPDRHGGWQPTIMSFTSKNFCTEFYDKSSYWYQYYTKYIANTADIRDKCFTNMGTIVQHETFDLSLSANIAYAPTLVGRRKLVINFEAFDQNQKKRPYAICAEVVGYLRQG